MHEVDYQKRENPKYFVTAHSAWCPPKRSELMEIQLKRPELSEPCLKDNEENKINDTQVGIPIKFSVNCNEDVEQNADIAFRLYPEGSDIKTTEAECTLRGKNINGIAETEELCWGTKNQESPPEGTNKYFFTAQTRNSPYITSNVFEIKLPEFSNLAWTKDSNNIENAIVNEFLILKCDVKNIPDYQQVIVEIFEPDTEGGDKHIFDVKGKIKDNKLEVEWKVEYLEKVGTKSKNEIDEQKYTIPEYHFLVRYFGYKSEASPVLKLKFNFIERALNKNNNPIPDTYYVLLTPDGQELYGKTDKKGFIRHDDLYIGKYKIIIAK